MTKRTRCVQQGDMATTLLLLGLASTLLQIAVAQQLPANFPQMFVPAGQQQAQQTQQGQLLPQQVQQQAQLPNFMSQLGFTSQAAFATGLCTYGCIQIPISTVTVPTTTTTTTTTTAAPTTTTTTTTTTTPRPVVPSTVAQCLVCGLILPSIIAVNPVTAGVTNATPSFILTTPAVATTTTTTTTTTARPITVVVQVQQNPGITYLNGYQLLKLKLAQTAFGVGNVLGG